MIKTVTPEKVNVKPKGVSKKGNEYWPIGIAFENKWYNGFVNSEAEIPKEGEPITIDVFQEEYLGKMYDKFKLPSKTDQVAVKTSNLEERVKRLEDAVFNTPKPKNTPPPVQEESNGYDTESGLPF